ncbi:hypothetical protein MMC25_006944 [Agyrium rufum]|nr:hypothetical protein [Agyrium rufum]
MSAGSLPPPLPPSVEQAYKKKCIDLRRRIAEIEESNDEYRRRKMRLSRGIRKMRLERAFLLENLAKRMRKSGHGAFGGVEEFRDFNDMYDEATDGSSPGPPTPEERPMRPNRRGRRVAFPEQGVSETNLDPNKSTSFPTRVQKIAPNPNSASMPATNGSRPRGKPRLDPGSDVDVEADSNLDDGQSNEPYPRLKAQELKDFAWDLVNRGAVSYNLVTLNDEAFMSFIESDKSWGNLIRSEREKWISFAPKFGGQRSREDLDLNMDGHRIEDGEDGEGEGDVEMKDEDDNEGEEEMEVRGGSGGGFRAVNG